MEQGRGSGGAALPELTGAGSVADKGLKPTRPLQAETPYSTALRYPPAVPGSPRAR